MPGPLAQEHPSRPHTQHAYDVGKRSNIYRLPQTPQSASPAPLFRTNSTTRHDEVHKNESRKRLRSGTSAEYFDTPGSRHLSAWPNASVEPSIISPGVDTPAALVNTTYRLAGGLDTPGIVANGSLELDDGCNELDFRRRWSVTYSEDTVATTDTITGLLARERNGKPRLPSSSKYPAAETWPRFVLGVAGAVAGKVWDFCKNSAFRGFYAGGGQGFDLKSPASTRTPGLMRATAESIWQDVEKRDSPFTSRASPLPGRLEGKHSTADSLIRESPPQRPVKRIHTDSGNGWILVPTPTSLERDSFISDKPSIRTPTTSTQTRRSAIPRSIAYGIKNSTSTGATPRPPLVSHAGSPALHSSRPASFASARSPSRPSPKRQTQYSTLSGNSSALSPEDKRYAARKDRETRQADDSMRKINSRLKAMIREGKEALGTTISVEDDFDEDGVTEVEVEFGNKNEDEDEGFVSGFEHGMKGW